MAGTTRTTAALAVAVIAACGAPAVRAQVPAPAPAASAASLQPVIVTADRRTENVKDVPSSVSTLSGEALDAINASGEDIRVIAGRVPSLNIESSFGRAFPRFYIRGYGNTDFRLNASQPVSLVYDDVVQENPILKGFPAFDLERIEVLAGPQGSLFGRNTPGGVVKFGSVEPTRRLEGYGSFSYGRFSAANFEGAVNVPLGEAWAARVSLLSQHRDDYVANRAPAQQTSDIEGHRDSALRAQLLYRPSSAFSALFNVHGRDLHGSARLFRANIIRPGSNDLVDGFDPYSVTIDGRNEQTLHTSGGSARLRWELGGGLALHSITGLETVRSFSRGDVDGGYGAVFAPPSGPGLIPFPSETADGIRDHRQFSQEVRIESPAAAAFSWQAGAYYFHEKYAIDAIGYDSLAGGTETSRYSTEQKTVSYAVFGSANVALAPTVKLRGDLRYTWDDKDLSTADSPGLQTSEGLAKSTSDRKLSWDVAGTWSVTPDANLYARVATGYRGSSIQPASAFAPLTFAGPETVLSYEVGAKADLFDRRARASLSLYRYRVKDQQLTAVGGATNSTILLNAERTIGQGVELGLDAFVTSALRIGINGSYNKTRIRDAGLTVATCAQCSAAGPAASIDGNPLPNAPKWIGNVNLRYGIPMADGSELYLYTDWSYRSKVNFVLYDSIEFEGRSLLTGGVRVGYVFGNGRYEAAAFVRNVTDEIRVTGGIDFNNLTGFVNEPRTFGVQLRATF